VGDVTHWSFWFSVSAILFGPFFENEKKLLERPSTWGGSMTTIGLVRRMTSARDTWRDLSLQVCLSYILLTHLKVSIALFSPPVTKSTVQITKEGRRAARNLSGRFFRLFLQAFWLSTYIFGTH